MNDPRPHVLVVAVGTAGDMYPLLRIARDLLARGHRVTLIGLQVHAPAAVRAGVPFHGLGTEADYRATLEHPDVWHPRKGFGVLWAGMRGELDTLSHFIDALPADERVVVLAHPLALTGASLARAARPNLRIVAAWLAPANLRSVHDPLLIGPLRIPRWLPLAWRHGLWRRVDAAAIDPVAVSDINAANARHGLPAIRHFIDHLQGVADAHVTLFPSWFAPTPPDWPQPLVEGEFPLYDPHLDASLPPELMQFLLDGAAPVVFTPGSGNRQAQRWLERAVQASRHLGRRALLLTPHREQVPARLPPGVLWLPYVPLGPLLPRVAALVHHGGIGTTAQALRSGVPQLVIPLAYDQFDNGARVEALMAGRMLAGWRARPRAIATALRQLLASDQVRAGCAQAAALAAAGEAVDLAARVATLLGIDDDALPLPRHGI